MLSSPFRQLKLPQPADAVHRERARVDTEDVVDRQILPQVRQFLYSLMKGPVDWERLQEELLENSVLQPGALFDAPATEAAADRVEGELHREGFYDAQVVPEVITWLPERIYGVPR